MASPLRLRHTRPSTALNLYRDEVLRIIKSHHGSNVRVFGSVLHQTDRVGSDLDLLIDPCDEMTLMDIGAIRFELRKLLGVPVDVLTPKALPEPLRSSVLSEAKPI